MTAIKQQADYTSLNKGITIFSNQQSKSLKNESMIDQKMKEYQKLL